MRSLFFIGTRHQVPVLVKAGKSDYRLPDIGLLLSDKLKFTLFQKSSALGRVLCYDGNRGERYGKNGV